MVRIIAAMSLALLATRVPLAAQQADTAADLEGLRAVYERELAKLNEEYLKDLAEAPSDYLKSLEALETAYQAAGELKALIAVRKERLRFQNNPDPAAVALATFPQKLQELQQGFMTNFKQIAERRAERIIELSRRYTSRLSALQRSLTRQGEIEQALQVMAEVESVAVRKEVNEAKAVMEGKPISAPTMDAPAIAVDTEALKQAVHGEIVAWNSVTGQITLKYDFSNEEQLKDWHGDPIFERGRMYCYDNTAWLRFTFSSISEIQYRGYTLTDGGGFNVLVGEPQSIGLTAEMLAAQDGKGTARIYQHSEKFPVIEFEEGIRAYRRCSGVLSIDGDNVVWTVNDREPRRAGLQQPIAYPLQIGVGCLSGRSTYYSVTISGKLHVDSMGQFVRSSIR